MISRGQWLEQAQKQLLENDDPSAILDAELILAWVSRSERIALHAHPETTLSPEQTEHANVALERRLQHEPMAYITGHKAFYGHDFLVTPNVLIPRPESEAIITTLQSSLSPDASVVLDIGTGSGALGIIAKLLYPKLNVTLVDISTSALEVARQNAERLHAKVSFLQSDLLDGYHGDTADIILANLPYVDRKWKVSTDTAYEPSQALFADNHGLALINRLLDTASQHLVSHGIVILESDPVQHAAITHYVKRQGYALLRTLGYAQAFTLL